MPTPARFYEGLTAESGHVALGWESSEGQHQNFRLMLGMLERLIGPIAGLSVHDAGCGHGDLIPHLRERAIGAYLGTDFMEEPLVIARKRYKWAGPMVNFMRFDLLRGIPPKADISILAGTLAYHTPDDAEAILESVWARTGKAMAFHSWWGMPRQYEAHKMVRETQRRIERFLRLRAKQSERLLEYGPAFEALFALSR